MLTACTHSCLYSLSPFSAADSKQPSEQLLGEVFPQEQDEDEAMGQEMVHALVSQHAAGREMVVVILPIISQCPVLVPTIIVYHSTQTHPFFYACAFKPKRVWNAKYFLHWKINTQSCYYPWKWFFKPSNLFSIKLLFCMLTLKCNATIYFVT